MLDERSGANAMVETPFIGYSGDCVIRGTLVAPQDARLTDFLNGHDSIHIVQARLFALDDGRVVDAGDVDLALDELYAVEAPHRAPDVGHRVRTRAARMQFQLGPYHVLGHVHSPSTADPVATVVRRKSMIPLTEATLSLNYAGRQQLRDLDVLIVNRDLAQVIEAVTYERGKIDEMFVAKVDPRAKDLTDEIYDYPEERRS